MLNEYNKKRDFRQTPEPQMAGKTRGGALIFVVQKHSARQLHYDFRLEVDGVLKSWAVAKGPSLDPGIKRLAVMVEDHPLDYAGFEGIIPAGQYGGGQVIIWDRGTYSPDVDGELHFGDRDAAEKMMRQGLASGKISVTLRGEKLKGSWTLVRMQKTEKNWLLIKHHDEYADSSRDILAEEISAVSGLTVADLKAGQLPDKDPPPALRPDDIPGATKKTFPNVISPMLASLAASPFSDEKWIFEPKLDGFRTLAFLNRGKVRLQSRGGLDVTSHYRTLEQSLEKQPASQLVLDGEIIALDARGKLCFQCLQGYLKSIRRLHVDKIEAPSAIIYYVFDILYLDGYDLQQVPLKARKELLQGIVVPDKNIRLVEHFALDGETVYRAAIANGMEGVVAKRQDSLYEAGKRAKTWLKIKAVNSDEFVICGYTPGTGSRAKTLGALVLGYYDAKNVLQPAGNVGTGFDDDLLLALKKQLEQITVKNSPFPGKIAGSAQITWVRPELVAEIKFAERTKDGRLRAPVFLRLRDDKPVADVHPAQTIQTHHRTTQSRAVKNIKQPDDLVTQLECKEINFTVEVAGQRLPLSNLAKIIWPERAGQNAVTKRALIIYLAKVAPYLLPHLKD
ncbi:MAG: non-homologous end-joining DNA ligase, partial [Dehalococcoidales bacterium]